MLFRDLKGTCKEFMLLKVINVKNVLPVTTGFLVMNFSHVVP